ncbi:MAG: 4Fe-4S binding protein, partial [Anaerolineae bacterium]|nr:4Fe-4S binding protein [Anaerolineae bacterium]
MKRKIITIDEKLCNGCGLCAAACHEGAIQMVDGKARLISESYCDGLGDCLPACPTGAITIEERDVAAYDETAVQAHLTQQSKAVEATACPTCPGTAAQTIQRAAPVWAQP